MAPLICAHVDHKLRRNYGDSYAANSSGPPMQTRDHSVRSDSVKVSSIHGFNQQNLVPRLCRTDELTASVPLASLLVLGARFCSRRATHCAYEAVRGMIRSVIADSARPRSTPVALNAKSRIEGVRPGEKCCSSSSTPA
jgi:hypothetical protein